MSEARSGAAAALAACVMWGLLGILYKQLDHADPVEVVAHRAFWGLVFLGLFCAATGRLERVRSALAERGSRRILFVSAAVISTNWLLFIWGVTSGHALEASLGYYIFPLIAAASSAFLLREGLGPWQRAAVALAAAAVGVLGWGLGVGPWLALALALTFTGYGLAKRSLSIGPISSVAAEAVLIAPVAGGFILGLHLGWWTGPVRGGGPAFGGSAADTALMVISGSVTAIPLILFSHAAQRLRYATLGFIQYLNPTLQFLVAALVFGEAVTVWHAIVFPMIWVALGLYSAEAWRRERAA